MLSAGQLNGHTRMGTLNVDFQCSKTDMRPSAGAGPFKGGRKA
jgi:hypothetical protein